MVDSRKSIQEMFEPSNRYDSFGSILMRIHAHGFRVHDNTFLEIGSPITAFCGLNGTGKSTLLQLAATAYRSLERNSVSHFNISDFMVVGTLDPQPFRQDARVEYRYWLSTGEQKTTTLSYNPNSQRWQGYNRRLQRRVFFTGIGHYLPRIEQRDFIIRHSNQLTIASSASVPGIVKKWTSKILSCTYDEIISNQVSYVQNAQNRSGEVVSATRYGVSYSETHMGYGEGRTLYLISTLEKLPEKSLVLIEEPETSLHPSAQHQLGNYLIDVVKRKRHQIFMTTHSMFLLTALPAKSIVYLKRTPWYIKLINGLSPLEVRSFLAEGHVKALTVLVEDDCAECILREMFLRVDPDFLKTIDLQIGGNAGALATTVRSLRGTQIPIACVRDADKGAAANENIFSLPGTLPPEKELFNSVAVANSMETRYGIHLHDFRASLNDVDHHRWFARLASYVNQSREMVLNEAAQAYAREISELEISVLIDQLKEASQQLRKHKGKT